MCFKACNFLVEATIEPINPAAEVVSEAHGSPACRHCLVWTCGRQGGAGGSGVLLSHNMCHYRSMATISHTLNKHGVMGRGTS